MQLLGFSPEIFDPENFYIDNFYLDLEFEGKLTSLDSVKNKDFSTSRVSEKE